MNSRDFDGFKSTDPEPGAEVAYGVTVNAAVGIQPADDDDG